MFFTYTVLAIFRAAHIVIASVEKLLRTLHVVKAAAENAYAPVQWLLWLGICELIGAAAILSSIIWIPLEIAAVLKLLHYFIGTLAVHACAGASRGVFTGIIPLLFSIIVPGTRTSS